MTSRTATNEQELEWFKPMTFAAQTKQDRSLQLEVAALSDNADSMYPFDTDKELLSQEVDADGRLIMKFRMAKQHELFEIMTVVMRLDEDELELLGINRGHEGRGRRFSLNAANDTQSVDRAAALNLASLVLHPDCFKKSVREKLHDNGTYTHAYTVSDLNGVTRADITITTKPEELISTTDADAYAESVPSRMEETSPPVIMERSSTATSYSGGDNQNLSDLVLDHQTQYDTRKEKQLDILDLRRMKMHNRQDYYPQIFLVRQHENSKRAPRIDVDDPSVSDCTSREIQISTARGEVYGRLYGAASSTKSADRSRGRLLQRGVVLVGGAGGDQFYSPADGLYENLGINLPNAQASESASSSDPHPAISLVLHIKYRHPYDLDEATHDTIAAVEALHIQYGLQTVGLVGHSLGGAVVINAAAYCWRVDSVVTLASQSYGISDTIAEVFPRPLLLVHGSKDKVLSPRCSEFIHQLASEPKRLEILRGAGHSLFEASEQVYHLVANWLVNCVSVPE